MEGDFMDEEDTLDELEGSDLSGCEDEKTRITPHRVK